MMASVAGKWLILLGIAASAVGVAAQQRWLAPSERLAATDGRPVEVQLPSPRSGPTTIALGPDGSVWFTLSSGNSIGRMSPDDSSIREFPLPNPNSSPRIIALGSDGNMWF
jgi:virginiamycin B lyase